MLISGGGGSRHRMQVSNGKTIWPMFARQTATTRREGRRERGGYLQHEEEGEKKRTRERRSLNSRLWAAPLKVVEIREEPRKERGEDERPATDGRTERTDLTTES